VSDIGIPSPASGNRLFKLQWPLIRAADPSQVVLTEQEMNRPPARAKKSRDFEPFHIDRNVPDFGGTLLAG
jgi:hypothetical protein